MVYNLVLFAHILGAFGLIAAYTIEAIGLRGLRGATRRDPVEGLATATADA